MDGRYISRSAYRKVAAHHHLRTSLDSGITGLECKTLSIQLSGLINKVKEVLRRAEEGNEKTKLGAAAIEDASPDDEVSRYVLIEPHDQVAKPVDGHGARAGVSTRPRQDTSP